MVRRRSPKHSWRHHARKAKVKHAAKDKHVGAHTPRFKTVNFPHNIW